MKIGSFAIATSPVLGGAQDKGIAAQAISRRTENNKVSGDQLSTTPVRTVREDPASSTYDRRRLLASEASKAPTTTGNSGAGSAQNEQSIFGDLDGNSTIDGADIGILLGKFGTNDSSGDLDQNGIVDGSDLKLLNEAFKRANQAAANGAPNAPEGPFGDLDGNSVIDGADLGLLLGKFGTNDSAGDLDNNGIVDGSDLKLLNEAFKRANEAAANAAGKKAEPKGSVGSNTATQQNTGSASEA